MRSAYTLITLHGLANLGFGLVFPFTAIYLADRPGIGTTGAGLYFAGAGMANLAVAILLAIRKTRLTYDALAFIGALLCMVGCLTLAQVTTLPAALLAALCNGAGQGCFMAAIVPLINSLVPAERRREVFGRRYQVQNVTLALGALISGVTASVLGRGALQWLFVVQTVGMLPLGAALGWTALSRPLRRYAGTRRATAGRTEGPHPALERHAVQTGPGSSRGTHMPLRGLARIVGTAALFQLGAFAFGFSQLEVTMPLVVDRLIGADLMVVSLMIALNVLVIVLAQGTVTRRLSSRPETSGLRLAVLCWVASFAVAAATSVGPTPVALAGVAGYVILFSIGECAYSCSFHPWLIAAVPEGELVRANALVNSMMGVGLFVGPSMGSALVGTGDALIVWGVLAACSTLVILAMRRRAGRPEPVEPPIPAGPPVQDLHPADHAG